MRPFKLNSDRQFIWSEENGLICVSTLDDMNNSLVTDNNWTHKVACIGAGESYDALMISGSKIHGSELKRLSVKIGDAYVLVNREGYCFLSTHAITGPSFHSQFFRLNDLFDWYEYDVRPVFNTVWSRSGLENAKVILDVDGKSLVVESFNNHEGPGNEKVEVDDDEEAEVDMQLMADRVKEISSETFSMSLDRRQQYFAKLHDTASIVPEFHFLADKAVRNFPKVVVHSNESFDTKDWYAIRVKMGEEKCFIGYYCGCYSFVRMDNGEIYYIPFYKGQTITSSIQFFCARLRESDTDATVLVFKYNDHDLDVKGENRVIGLSNNENDPEIEKAEVDEEEGKDVDIQFLADRVQEIPSETFSMSLDGRQQYFAELGDSSITLPKFRPLDENVGQNFPKVVVHTLANERFDTKDWYALRAKMGDETCLIAYYTGCHSYVLMDDGKTCYLPFYEGQTITSSIQFICARLRVGDIDAPVLAFKYYDHDLNVKGENMTVGSSNNREGLVNEKVNREEEEDESMSETEMNKMVDRREEEIPSVIFSQSLNGRGPYFAKLPDSSNTLPDFRPLDENVGRKFPRKIMVHTIDKNVRFDTQEWYAIRAIMGNEKCLIGYYCGSYFPVNMSNGETYHLPFKSDQKITSTVQFFVARMRNADLTCLAFKYNDDDDDVVVMEMDDGDDSDGDSDDDDLQRFTT